MGEDRYAITKHSALRLHLNDKYEIFVKDGVGWISPHDLKVGHVTNFGTVVCVGTLDEIRRYWEEHEG